MTSPSLGHYSVVSVSGPVSGNVYAGEINWEWLGAAPAGFTDTFYTYCVDILHYVADPQTVVLRSTDDLNPTNVATASPDAGAKAAWLVNTYAADIRSRGSEANVQAAALQVAIWEAVYDSVNSLSSGMFSVVGPQPVLNQASVYLTDLYAGPGGYYTSQATWFDTANGQDQIGIAVPEPASLSLLGFGILALGSRRRRGRRVN
jgi:hypothetical protein